MGPTVEMPTGCYSDDTQLRLAVGRCIRSSGRFDIEVFSKVELPVFLSYELGAGRGTKAAARSLGRRATRWFSNFFDSRGSRYLDGGGNGAAMRIQPHVWAAADGKPESYIPPLLRDVLCTHGHPRGILGAAFHALALSAALHQGALPDPDRWERIVDYLPRIVGMVEHDDILAERWLPVWEDGVGRPFVEALDEAVAELREQIAIAARNARAFDGRDAENTYQRIAGDLGGLKVATRGAGTISSVLAIWLAWCLRDRPADAVRLSAELLGSDTDTIASMAGALVGAVAQEDPPGPVLDQDLIVEEARRLEGLRRGEPQGSFAHPDPLRWQPPNTLSDALGLMDGRPAIAGLGHVEELGELISGHGNNPGGWQWVRTDYGQTLLVKRRSELHELPPTVQPRPRPPGTRTGEPASSPPRAIAPQESALPDDPETGITMLAERGFEPELIGRLLSHYGRQGATAAAVFATLFSTRLRERERGTTSTNGSSPHSD